ncbi:tfiih, polypeptide, putative [Perkinsus marinus ATCC 50983]|uniref:General transcription factor IIH subunit 4 n=1 Tax=Perkinsus marinus (strain ATCC 50983 / TXsc) TaxID=423536 RepID=C5KB18_PERM5|nr:tfiih, polypeptide, putative [Perkinsus marinus ATCC 50983]EER18344.1 tfiih, polypeptide, putative [Perkinsus marinus ATCC 50983]|eukprot:XP_002786548.1 tfiih, polypeptide, putative [Perkinsus marinus ATCC 50983]
MPSPSGSGSAKSGSTFGNDLFGYLIHLATLYQRPPGKLVFLGTFILGALFEELYKDPAVVAYVYSRLNGIGKVFINRLILVHRPIQQGVIRHWISSLHDSDHSKYRAALSQLTKLHILLMDPKGQHLRMSSNFRQRLHEVFLKNTSDDHQSPPWEILEEAKVDVSKVDGVLTNGGAPRDAGMNRLDEYAALRWEYVLEAMVDGMTAAVGDASLRPEGARQGLSGIVGMSSTSTSTGQLFQFVLASRTSQYWELVRRAFDMIERQHGIQSLLAPIRMVVALTRSIKHEPERLLPGTRIRVNPQCMATPGAKGAVTTLLETLADLGIVVPATYDDELRKVAALQRQYGESVKYELPLVSSDSRMVVSSLVYVMQASRSKMMMSVDDTTAITNKSCRLFVDSNFAVTAYTTSSLDLRLLGTFVQLQRQLGDGREYDPNDFGCVLGTLTQSSVQSAAQRGVTSEYIISYLKSHVDPRAAHMGSQGGRSSAATANTGAARGEKFIDGIPANVVTQITLWEREAIHNRLRIDPGVAIQNPAATTAMDQFTGMTQSEEAAKYVTRMMQACGVYYERTFGVSVESSDE